jgi:hypothetical protein
LRATRKFLLNLTGFAACIEGLFFVGAFTYVEGGVSVSVSVSVSEGAVSLDAAF